MPHERRIAPDDRVMLVKVGSSAAGAESSDELYEQARQWWRASLAQAERVRRVLAIDGGVVVAAYEPLRWETPSEPHLAGRIAFHGVEASDASRFVGRNVTHLFKPGAANPVRYTTVAALVPAAISEKPEGVRRRPMPAAAPQPDLVQGDL